MKNYFKNLVAAGVAALTLFTASPAIYATNKTKIAEDYKTINQYYQLEHQKEKINQELANINKEIKQKNIKINPFKPYGKDLTLEDYTKIIESIQKYNLKERGFETFIKLERVLKDEQFINTVADYYKIDKQDMIRLWNQESNFDITQVGSHGERGLAQFRNLTAKLILDRLISPKDSIYFEWKRFYPEFNLKNYDFKQLSEDYKLNIIMTAAQVRVTSNMLDYFLKKANLSQNQLIKIIKQKGTTTNFEKLRTVAQNPQGFGLNKELEKTIRNYNITNQRIAEVHKLYREKENMLPAVVDYIMHNGGDTAVQNIISDSFTGELLIYHLAMYLKNLGGLYNLMNYHYDNLENMIKSNDYLLKNLTTGKPINIWGNEIRKLDLQKLRKYSQHGLIENMNPDFFQKDQLTIMKNFTIDENLNLKPVDKRLTNLCNTNDIDELYEKLVMFKQLEELQNSLNKAYESKDQKDMKTFGVKVTTLENDINKRFKMQRAHTGIGGLQKDVAKLEEDIKRAGFIPDLERYKSMITSKNDTIMASKNKTVKTNTGF